MQTAAATSSTERRDRRCPACAGPLSPWWSVPSSEPGIGEPSYPLARCARCGTAVTLGAPPAGLHDLGAYCAAAPRLHRLAQPALRAFDRRRLALARALVPPPARLVDAGAGRGRFVAAAGAAGYVASGIEPSARGADAAAARGAPVWRARIDEAPIAVGSLDLVSLWHVLEHLDDPRAALERMRSWLRPGGGLLIGVPNLDSLQARVGRERWFHLDVPRHRVHFTEPGIRLLLGDTGFVVERTHHTLLEHNPFGMWQSAVNRVTRHPSYLYNLLKRNAPMSWHDLVITTAALPLAPCAALFELGAGLTRRGGTIAVLARREQ